MKPKHFSFLSLIFTLIFTFSTNVVFARQKLTAPAAPTSFKATAVSSSEIDLSWQAVSGALGYRVYRATPNDSNYTLIATTAVTSFKNTGLNSGATYWYYVKAYNTYGYSAGSLHVKAVTNASAAVSKEVLGFATYYYSGDTSSYNSITANASLINQIDTDTYTTDTLGNLSGMVPTNQITYANSIGIKTMAMVTNNFSGSIAQTLLESSTNRQTLISNILSSLKTNGYKGVNIDFEGVYYNDRSYFTTFMSELYNALKPQGFSISVDVPAKTNDSLTNSWSGAFDYAQIANYADQILLMTYDEHYPGGTAGPIASIGWVQNVVNYAVTVIPKSKILLGVAAYGYDWSANGTKAYSISQVNNLAATYGATILWDSTSQSPYFSYTDSAGVSHTVWFENSTSVGYKLDIVNNSNIAGIGIWRLGLEDSNYWTTIKTKFNK